MVYRWVLKAKFPLLMLLLPVLLIAVACGEDTTPTPTKALATPTATSPPLPTATPTPAPPAFTTSTTKRLVAALGPPTLETNLPWGSSIVEVDKKSLYENLIGIERTTGELAAEQGLATEWGVSSDFRNWTFKLREDIPFQFDWGEFTARDVVHSMAMVMQEASLSGARGVWIKIIDNVEAVGDHEVIFHQTQPEIFEIPFRHSGKLGAIVMMSKAQWDAEGEAGYLSRPTGTGPYQYVERIPGNSLLSQRVEDHWRQTPEFQEYQVLFAAETTTRMAALLAREAHIATLPRDLQKTVTDRGMELVFSVLPSIQTSYFFGGSHFDYDGLVAAGFDMTKGRSAKYPQTLDSDVSPWLDPDTGILVREAMNRAINREELRDTIFAGQGEFTKVWGFHPSQPGYNSRWDAEFDAKYGYDPAKARDLLTQAGYPNGFDHEIHLFPHFTVPASIAMGEIIGGYFEDIGLNITFTTMEYSRSKELARNRRLGGISRPFMGGYRDPQPTFKSYYSEPGGASVYENELTWTKYNELTRAITAEDRDRIMREVGDHLFDNYGGMPLFWFLSPALVNPDVVAEFIYPGNIRELYSHIEYIKAADTQ